MLKKRGFSEACDSESEYYKNVKIMKLCDIDQLDEELKNISNECVIVSPI
jgi:hypothetical protein